MTEVLQSGPHHHNGSGVVSQDVSGLAKDNTYFVKVLVDTVARSLESNSYQFGECFSCSFRCQTCAETKTIRVGKVAC